METSQALPHFQQHNLGPNGFGHLTTNGFGGEGMTFGALAANCGTGVAPGVGHQSWQRMPNGRCGDFNGGASSFGQPVAPFGACGIQRKRSLESDDYQHNNGGRVMDTEFSSSSKRQRPCIGELVPVHSKVTKFMKVVGDRDWISREKTITPSWNKWQNPSSNKYVEPDLPMYNIAVNSTGFVGCADSQGFERMDQSTPVMPDAAMNTSAVEHATSVTASRGYDAMYAYNLMLSEVYGC